MGLCVNITAIETATQHINWMVLMETGIGNCSFNEGSDIVCTSVFQTVLCCWLSSC